MDSAKKTKGDCYSGDAVLWKNHRMKADRAEPMGFGIYADQDMIYCWIIPPIGRENTPKIQANQSQRVQQIHSWLKQVTAK